MNELPPGLHGAHKRADLHRQLGVFAVRMLLEQHQLIAVTRSVLVDRRTMLSLPTRAAAGLLMTGPRGVLTSHTAALVHGCTAADAGLVHLLAQYPRRVRRRPGYVVHNGRFDEDDVIELAGLRTLALDRVITDMLCRDARSTALACADQALAFLDPRFRDDFKATVAERIMERTDVRGRRRSAALLELATGLPESPAESRMLLRLVDAGLPVPSLQHAVCDLDGDERYRLDFAWVEPMVALEYDGYEAHAERRRRDELRDHDLMRRGWLVIRAESADLRSPARLVDEVRSAFRERRFAA